MLIDRLEVGEDIRAALDLGRIRLRPNQHEIVVHHREPLNAEPVGHELLFLRLGMHEHHIGIATAAGVERLAGALRDHPHINAGLGGEPRQDETEQPRTLGRGGRGHDDRLVGGRRRHCRGHEPKHEEHQAVTETHWLFLFPAQLSSPAKKRRPVAVAGALKKAAAAVRSTTPPLANNTMSPASRRAWPRSWVAITILTPRSAVRRMMSSTALLAAGSRLAVGSSRNSTSGSRASARASASRCSPPDSRRAGRSANGA